MKEIEEISASMTRYYDFLTEEEVAESETWGQFAEEQFAAEERGGDCFNRTS
jgi:hypothetical protein